MTRAAPGIATGCQSARPSCSFSAAERAFIRRELGLSYNGGPHLMNGITLRIWRSGPLKGRPKLPAFMASMVMRGLFEVRAGSQGSRACFTEAGLEALRHFVLSDRAVERSQFAHLRSELGVVTASGESGRHLEPWRSHHPPPAPPHLVPPRPPMLVLLRHRKRASAQ